MGFYNRQALRRPSGASLMELMVVLGLLGLVSLVMVGVHRSSAKVADQTKARVDLQQSARETMKRITPFLVSAVPPGATEQTAWNLPTLDAVAQPTATGLTGNNVTYVTTEDYLTLDSGSTTGWKGSTSAGYNPFFPALYLYRISVEPDGFGANQLLLQKLTSYSPLVVATFPRQRILARRIPKQTDITFTRLSMAAIQLRVTTRGNVRRPGQLPRAIAYTLESLVQQPGGL